jgi:hypothetical protein
MLEEGERELTFFFVGPTTFIVPWENIACDMKKYSM